MNNNQFNLTFETELNEGIRVTTLSPVFCSGDNEAHSFIVKAMRKGKPVSLSGATVRGFFIRPDNVTITLEGSVNASGEAVVTLSDSCYNKQGRFQIIIRATINGVASTLFCGMGGMLITSTDSFIDDGNIVSLDDLLDQIEAMEEATARANEAADRADPDAIVQMVLAELGASVIGTVDEDNNIILTGDLAAGTYTLKYENANGTQTEIGTVEVGGTDEGGDDTGEDTTEPTETELALTWSRQTTVDSSTGVVGSANADRMSVSNEYTLNPDAVYTLKNLLTDDTWWCNIYAYWYGASGYLGRTHLTEDLTDNNVPNGWVYTIAPMDGATTVRFRLNYGDGMGEYAEGGFKFYETV